MASTVPFTLTAITAPGFTPSSSPAMKAGTSCAPGLTCSRASPFSTVAEVPGRIPIESGGAAVPISSGAGPRW